MEIVREIRHIDSGKIEVTIPAAYMHKNVEIVVSYTGQPNQPSQLQEKLEAVDRLNGLIADQSREDLDEFDRIISQRPKFRERPIAL